MKSKYVLFLGALLCVTTNPMEKKDGQQDKEHSAIWHLQDEIKKITARKRHFDQERPAIPVQTLPDKKDEFRIFKQEVKETPATVGDLKKMVAERVAQMPPDSYYK